MSEGQPDTGPDRLDSLDKNEMFDLSRAFNLRLTREEFECDWNEFQDLKRRKQQT